MLFNILLIYLLIYGILSCPISALLLGGVGGSEVLTRKTNIIRVIVEKIGHTQFIVGMSSGVDTKAGVSAWLSIVPSKGEKARNTVTKICSAPANQFWLTFKLNRSLFWLWLTLVSFQFPVYCFYYFTFVAIQIAAGFPSPVTKIFKLFWN